MVNRSPSQRGGLQRTVSGRTPQKPRSIRPSGSMRHKPPNHSLAAERRPQSFVRAAISFGIAFVALLQLHNVATTKGASSRWLRDQHKQAPAYDSSSTTKAATPVVQGNEPQQLELSTGQDKDETGDRGDHSGPGVTSMESRTQRFVATQTTAPKAPATSEKITKGDAEVRGGYDPSESMSTNEEKPATVATTKVASQTTAGVDEISQPTDAVQTLLKDIGESDAAQTSDAQVGTSPKATAVSTEALARHVDGTSPVKLTESGQIDWDSIDHVYYYHTRKAGGTTLVKWVRLMAWKHGKNFTKDEGPVFDHEMFEGNDRVLLVTSLRPPTDRAISSYNFDLNQVGEDLSVAEFISNAHGYNTRKHTQYIRSENRKRGWIWRCASECYSKWFGGWPTPEFMPNTEKAVETLNKFEIIWMKNLKNDDYMKWLTHRFNDTKTSIPHKRKTSKEKSKLSEVDMNLFNSANEKDAALYNALREKWERIVPLNSTLI